MEGKILQLVSVLVKLSVIDVVFGLQQNDKMKLKTVKKIDFLILVAKTSISIKKKTNSPLPLHTIFELQLIHRGTVD